MKRSPRHAFTLIELLVVVAIIVALLAILLPSMGKAVEVAQRAVCGSQIGQLSQGTLAYAAEYRGAVPIGHGNDKFQFNYLIWRNDSNQGFWAFGLLYKANILSDPGVHYCPSEQSSNYDTAANPWYTRQPVSGTSIHTRSDFGMRPVVNWNTIGGKIQPDGAFPTIQSLGNVAILSDRFPFESAIDRRHVEGINAGGLDGSVGWVDRSAIQESLDDFVDGAFDAVNNNAQWEIWQTLDRQR